MRPIRQTWEHGFTEWAVAHIMFIVVSGHPLNTPAQRAKSHNCSNAVSLRSVDYNPKDTVLL